MLMKTIMVSIFILLSWNSIQLSKSNEFLRSELKQTIADIKSTKESIITNQSLLNKQLLNHQEHSESLLSNQKSIKNLIEKNTKANLLMDKQGKVLTKIQSSLGKIDSKITEQTKLNDINKNNIVEIKKTSYRISDQIKKHSKNHVNHYKKSSSHKFTKKKTVNKNIKTKPVLEKMTVSKELNPFYKMAVALHKTIELHSHKNMEKASEELLKLKSEIWKSRKIENSPTKLVMSILSSIDITKNKWDNKEFKHDLKIVEEKINQLFFKLGVTK